MSHHSKWFFCLSTYSCCQKTSLHICITILYRQTGFCKFTREIFFLPFRRLNCKDFTPVIIYFFARFTTVSIWNFLHLVQHPSILDYWHGINKIILSSTAVRTQLFYWEVEPSQKSKKIRRMENLATHCGGRKEREDEVRFGGLSFIFIRIVAATRKHLL